MLLESTSLVEIIHVNGDTNAHATDAVQQHLEKSQQIAIRV